MAEYAASTAEHIVKRAQDVPSELLSEMLGMLSPTQEPAMVIKACKALARVAQFIDLTQVEPDDVQVLLSCPKLTDLQLSARCANLVPALRSATHQHPFQGGMTPTSSSPNDSQTGRPVTCFRSRSSRLCDQVLLARLLELSKADTDGDHTATILGALAGMTHAMGQVPHLSAPFS